MNFMAETSPHIRRKDTLNGMMIDVLIALSPVVVFALIVYQWAAVRNLVVSVLTMGIAEFLFVIGKGLFQKRKESLSLSKRLAFALSNYHWSNFLVPSVSAVIYALITPATFWAEGSYDPSIFAHYNAFTDGYAYLVLIVGSLFGIIIGKLIFGGTGRNVFNPAAAGFVFAKLVFGSRYAVANYPTSAFGWPINTGATFLKGDYWSASAYSKGYSGILDLLIGSVPGLMGETCKIAILLGLVYLLVRHTIDWRVVASFFGTFFFFMLFAGVIAHVLDGNVDVLQFALYQLLSGGVLFGGVFMLTDPVTMPLSRPDRLLFGMMVAISTVFFRLFFVEEYTHEGMAFSILIVNAIVPLLDSHYWNTNVYAKKNWVALTALPLAMVGVMVLTLLAQKGFFTNGGVPSSSSSESTVSTGGTKNLMFLGGLFPFLR